MEQDQADMGGLPADGQMGNEGGKNRHTSYMQSQPELSGSVGWELGFTFKVDGRSC